MSSLGGQFRAQVYEVIKKVVKRDLTEEEHEKIKLSLIAWVESVKVKEQVERIYTCRECHQKKKMSPNSDKFLKKLKPAKVETVGENKRIYNPPLAELRTE
jgi:hypothetical protein